MDAEDIASGLFLFVTVGAFLALMITTALFFVSIGVWPIVVWGWFTVIVLGTAMVGIAVGNS